MIGVRYRWERRRLLAMLPRGGVGAEIGVWRGDMSAALLRHTKPRRLVLIDPWRYRPDYEAAWYGGDIGQEGMDAIHDEVSARFAAEVEAGVVEIHRSGSVEAADCFSDGSFDWVYVDGDHTYESVRRDLELYRAKVRPGGILAGDDYATAGWWQGGVTRAVDELVATGLVEPVKLGLQFVLRVPASA